MYRIPWTVLMRQIGRKRDSPQFFDIIGKKIRKPGSLAQALPRFSGDRTEKHKIKVHGKYRSIFTMKSLILAQDER
jgi:hypothetical protein